MCFSYKSSILAWIAALFISIYLYNRNNKYDRWNAIFIFTFTLIQLFESGIWHNIESGNNDKSTNEFYTKLILVGLTCQPLVQTYFGYISSKSDTLYYLLIAYIAFVGYSLYRILLTSEKFSSDVGPNKHLIWNSNTYKHFLSGPYFITSILYLLGLLLPLIYQGSDSVPLLLIGLCTLLYSLSYAKTGEFGSMWCRIAVLYGVVCVTNT